MALPTESSMTSQQADTGLQIDMRQIVYKTINISWLGSHMVVSQKVEKPKKRLISFYVLVQCEGPYGRQSFTDKKAKIVGRVQNANLSKIKPLYECRKRIALTSKRIMYAGLVDRSNLGLREPPLTQNNALRFENNKTRVSNERFSLESMYTKTKNAKHLID